MTDSQSLTKEEFHGFVLVYAAHADKIVKDVEVACITSRTSEEIYDKMSALFAELGPVEGFKLLVRNKERFYPGAKGTKELLEGMHEVFLSDEEYHPDEEKLYEAMKNIFTQLR